MMYHLLPLAALLLLSVIPTENKVVTSVEDCKEFLLIKQDVPFVKGNILDQNRYKVICQTLRNISRFVMLYDMQNRIPVFSAAECRGGGEGCESLWKFEPHVSLSVTFFRFNTSF